MIDLLKKTLLAGVGAAVVTKDKIESTLEDFVRAGKVSAADARIMAEKIADQGRREWDEMANELSRRLSGTMDRSESDLRARLTLLEERMRVLEARVQEPPTRSGEP